MKYGLMLKMIKTDLMSILYLDTIIIEFKNNSSSGFFSETRQGKNVNVYFCLLINLR